MNPKLLLCLALVLSGGLFGCSDEKTDERIESVKLPSGEILENHTYLKTGWGSDRCNTLFLKNPATGASEQIDDRFGYLNYEAGPNDPSLLQRYPHPQEFVHGDEKVLIIGSYICKRCIWKTGPEWDIASFGGGSGDAAKYLRSFVKTNSTFFSSPDSGPGEYLHYQIENLDLENNILTIKRISWNAQTEPSELRDFPDYLVFSTIGYNGQSGYQFPWKFDEARTRAKNGPRWLDKMPFRMVLDYSVIIFPDKPGFFPYKYNRDKELTITGARETLI